MEQKYESLVEVVGGVLRQALREAARPVAFDEAQVQTEEAVDPLVEANRSHALH